MAENANMTLKTILTDKKILVKIEIRLLKCFFLSVLTYYECEFGPSPMKLITQNKSKLDCHRILEHAGIKFTLPKLELMSKHWYQI